MMNFPSVLAKLSACAQSLAAMTDNRAANFKSAMSDQAFRAALVAIIRTQVELLPDIEPDTV